ncbi:hypothetical protein IMCC12053_2473 [Celeribacter marinus]|uniref:Uncharacterized protein n=1 Tax=Celeribacter marinus TaxID=1397108 RepID=A0A0P0A119_9RHOB|nr:hypothetical protein IMCC12053_2473 [Celeribacter marinus]
MWGFATSDVGGQDVPPTVLWPHTQCDMPWPLDLARAWGQALAL